MDTVQNVKKVSLVFFIVLTGTHLMVALMLGKGYTGQLLSALYGALDIPAICAGILYGFTSLKMILEKMNKNTHLFDIVAGIVGGIIFMAILYINFFNL